MRCHRCLYACLALALIGTVPGCKKDPPPVDINVQPKQEGEPTESNKAPVNLVDAKPDFKLTVDEYLEESEKDSKQTRSRYEGKILEITGVVGHWAWFKFAVAGLQPQSKARGLGAMCTFQEADPWKKAVPGQKITIRAVGNDNPYEWALKDAVIVEAGPYQGVVVSAEQIATETEADLPATVQKYNGKFLAIDGEFIGKEPPTQKWPHYCVYVRGTDKVVIECPFNDEYKLFFDQFVPGDRVKILGEFDQVRQADDMITLFWCVPFVTECSKPGSATKAPALTWEAIKVRKKEAEKAEEKAIAFLKEANVLSIGSLRSFQISLNKNKDAFTTSGEIKPEFLEAISRLGNQEMIYLYGSPISDAGLAALASMPRIKELSLFDTKITAAGIGHLRKLKQLRELGLTRLEIGDTGLEQLKDMKSLESLGLAATKVTDKGLANLAGLNKLRSLHLSKNDITGVGLVHLKDKPELTWLSLSDNPLSDDGLQHLAKLPKLANLDLDGTAVTDAGLAHLAALPKLERLDLDKTDVTDKGLMKLATVKTLRSVSASDCPGVTPAGLESLKKLLAKNAK